MSQPLPQLGDEEELVSRLAAAHRHGKKVVFLVGAPLVAPVRKGEPGVPGVAEMIARVQAALDGEVELPAPEVPGAYQQAFEILNRRRGLPQVNTVVREAVLEACRAEPGLLTAAATGDSEACKTLEGRLDVWEHTPGVRGLGQLIAALPATFGHTLLTSNFDPLIETAIRRAGGLCWQTTLHTDGSLEASEAPGCRAVHVHGFWRGNGDTLHTPLQLSRPRPQLENSLRRLFESTLVVVVAYGGWEDVFTRGLARVVADAGASPEVLWTFYAAGVERVQKNGDAILRLLAPAGESGGAFRAA